MGILALSTRRHSLCCRAVPAQDPSADFPCSVLSILRSFVPARRRRRGCLHSRFLEDVFKKALRMKYALHPLVVTITYIFAQSSPSPTPAPASASGRILPPVAARWLL